MKVPNNVTLNKDFRRKPDLYKFIENLNIKIILKKDRAIKNKLRIFILIEIGISSNRILEKTTKNKSLNMDLIKKIKV